MPEFQCARCGKSEPRLPGPPMPGEVGVRLYDQVCELCWQEWLQYQTALINHYGLAVRDPRAKEFLTQQRETFFFEASPSDTD